MLAPIVNGESGGFVGVEVLGGEQTGDKILGPALPEGSAGDRAVRPPADISPRRVPGYPVEKCLQMAEDLSIYGRH
jgi:hypothetical protein